MTEITRAYDAAEPAESAVRRLKVQGFADDAIDFSAPSQRASGEQRQRWVVSVRPPFGSSRIATDILDRFGPVEATVSDVHGHGGVHARGGYVHREPGLEAIHRLSGPVSPGAIAGLSRDKSPGAIGRLSGYKAPGAIARLSGYKAPGAIATLSRSKPSGAISRLSRSHPSTGAISRLSNGWFFSSLLGLPLITRSQAPLEPDNSLLTGQHRQSR